MQVCCMSCVRTIVERNFSVTALLTRWQLGKFRKKIWFFDDFQSSTNAYIRNSCCKELCNCMWQGALTFIPVQTLQTKKWAVTLHCSVRGILFLLEELNDNSCAVHMSSRMVTHTGEILQGRSYRHLWSCCSAGGLCIQPSHSWIPKSMITPHYLLPIFSAHCASC